SFAGELRHDRHTARSEAADRGSAKTWRRSGPPVSRPPQASAGDAGETGRNGPVPARVRGVDVLISQLPHEPVSHPDAQMPAIGGADVQRRIRGAKAWIAEQQQRSDEVPPPIDEPLLL